MKKLILIFMVFLLAASAFAYNGITTLDYTTTTYSDNTITTDISQEEYAAEKYCLSLGYKYYEKKCYFRDGSSCPALEFYYGKCLAPLPESIKENTVTTTQIVTREEEEVREEQKITTYLNGRQEITERIRTLTSMEIQEAQTKFQYQNQEMIKEEVKSTIESDKEEIEKPTLTHRFAVQLEGAPSFQYEVVKRIGDSNIYIIDVENKQIREMAKDQAIEKFGDESSVERFKEYARNRLREQFREEAKEMKLAQTRGVQDIEQIEEEVEQEVEVLIQEEVIKEDKNKLAYYQYFVTPNDPAIQQAALGKSPEALYNYVASTAWVSDKTLFGVLEKWVLPKDFLASLELPNNPSGIIASDCSEKANTLVSLMRASGVPSTNVRVVLGKVDFGGTIGGHAWAEYYYNGQWLALEPSSGPYFDDTSEEMITRKNLEFDHFQTYEYPVIEVYYRYNDEYFEDLTSGESNAPDNWAMFATTSLDNDLSSAFEDRDNILTFVYLAIFVGIGYLLAKSRRK